MGYRYSGFRPFNKGDSDQVVAVDMRSTVDIANKGGALSIHADPTNPLNIPRIDPARGLVGATNPSSSTRGGYRFSGATFESIMTAAKALALRERGSIYLWVGRECFKANALADENFFDIRTSPDGSASVSPLIGRYGAVNNWDVRYQAPNYGPLAISVGLRDSWDLLPEVVPMVVEYSAGHVWHWVDGQPYRVRPGFGKVNSAGHSPNFQDLMVGAQFVVTSNNGSNGMLDPDNIFQWQIVDQPLHLPTYPGRKNLTYFLGGTELSAYGGLDGTTNLLGIRAFAHNTVNSNNYHSGLMAVSQKAYGNLGYRGYVGHAAANGDATGNLNTATTGHIAKLRTKGVQPGIVVIDLFTSDAIAGTAVGTVETNLKNAIKNAAAGANLFALGVEKVIINNCASLENHPTYATQAKRDLVDSYNAMAAALPTFDSRISVVNKFEILGGHTPDASLFMTAANAMYMSARGHFLFARDGEIPEIQRLLRAG